MQKRFFIKHAIAAAFVLLAHPCLAEPLQLFTLKDGSTIKAHIISYAQGLYTVQSDQLGRLQIPGDKVVSITSAAPQSQAAPQSAPAAPPTASALSPAISQQLSDVQNQISANPALMQEIEKVAKDKELAALLSDPAVKNELINALRSSDPRIAENNPKIQKILENPQIQNLLKQMSSGAKPPSR